MGTAMILTPAWNNPGQPFRHSWEGLGNIDQFRWFVRADCQEHLAFAHEELGLRHVRAVGMFGLHYHPLLQQRQRIAPPLSPLVGPQEDRINKSPNFFNCVVHGTRSLLDSLGFRGEVHWQN